MSPSSGAPPLRVEYDGAVSRIVLARPEAANTVNLTLARSLVTAVDEIGARHSRVVILAAEGRAFCGGGDVREMAAAADVAAYVSELADTFHDALRLLHALDAVTIAAVDGAAAGGGLGLALSADVIIAGEHARFLTAYETIGLTPDSGVSWLLPRAIGTARAAAMSTLSLLVDARTAYEWGMVAEVVASDRLEATVTALSERLAQRPTDHLAQTRRLYHSARTYEDVWDAEARSISRAALREPAASALRTFGESTTGTDDSASRSERKEPL